MVLQVAIDDSETKPGPGHLVMGGFLSTAERWAKFSDEWSAALAKKPTVEGGEFGWADATNLCGGFRGFTPSQRDARLLVLARIIRRHALFRMHTGISHEQWNLFRALPAKERTQKTDLPNPLLLVMCCRMAAIGAHWLELDEPCDIFFDQASYEHELHEEWPRILSIVRRECAERSMSCVLDSPPTYRPAARFAPLQAADFYAGALRQALETGSPPSKPLNLLFMIPGLDFPYLKRRVADHLALMLDKEREFKQRYPLHQLAEYDPAIAARVRKRNRAARRQKPSSS